MSTPRLLSNRYELGDTLGYGGMSEVHHGHDVRLGREVAIKILRADLARDPQFLERFRREAQNAAALNHPAIVAVYDTGEANTEFGPLPYIVMEYVEGRTLRDIVKTEGPLSQKRAMEVMADVCAALDFSHRHGIVHRDVKPANVMITKNGAVKVMDFGIARAMHDGQSAMTQTAAVIGTAQYLSPEQARGESVDARSDVYAAGCVLYELVTGEPPFTGDSPVAVAYQHVREDPSAPSTVNPAVSPELDAVVLKALAKGPANRYQSAAEMRSDLVRTLSGQRPSAPMVMSEDERTQVMDTDRRTQAYDDYAEPEEDPKAKRRRRIWLAIGAGVFVLAAVLGIMALLGAFNYKSEAKPIPQVLHQQVEVAKAKLRSQGFTNIGPDKQVVCGGAQPTDGGPTCTADDIGKVVKIEPGEGQSIPVDQQVTLSVGAKPGQTSVPDLKGKSLTDAVKELTNSKLRIGNTTEVEVSDPSQAGMVQSQNPAAGSSVELNSTVDIVVGKAQGNKNAQDYTGQQYSSAAAALKAAGFTVKRVDQASDKPEGEVISQSASGSLPPGTTITLVVSDGSQQQITLPDLTGQTPESAQQLLQAKGWKGQFNKQTDRSGKGDPGTIVKTNPQSGTQIGKTATVTIFVADSNGNPTSSSSSTSGLFPPGRP
ncbi:Stk1 family PASTA domain-containing Ser/Thr kinase [Amycolatopsis sp. NPDC059021]|uniref:Stk1 family PASTA domain-containing Ser/Thr kinase n=1 Tax=Amycolatopsis sp. NPDC059021 TaxID=3346704 RepID=UPI00366D6126